MCVLNTVGVGPEVQINSLITVAITDPLYVLLLHRILISKLCKELFNFRACTEPLQILSAHAQGLTNYQAGKSALLARIINHLTID